MCSDAKTKETKNFQVSFDVIDDSLQTTNGYQFVECRMIFDVEMEDFHWKTRSVTGEHMEYVLATERYASVMSRETILIA